MAGLDQLTIQGSSVVNDLHDRRITTTAITTCTHILASQAAGLTSIAPITAANLASVLGVVNHERYVTDANSLIMQPGFHLADFGTPSLVSNLPQGCDGWGVLFSVTGTNQTLQIVSDHLNNIWIRTADSTNIQQWIKLI